MKLMELMGNEDIDSFIELTNNIHPTITFTAEISDIEISFQDTVCLKDLKRNLFLASQPTELSLIFRPLSPCRHQEKICQMVKTKDF